MGQYPGWRTMTKAERYNARAEAMFERARLQEKAKAIATFRLLVARYGLQWTADVPREAHIQLAECNKRLTEKDRRAALGLEG